MPPGTTTPQTAPAKQQRRIAVEPLQMTGSAPPRQKPSECQGQTLHVLQQSANPLPLTLQDMCVGRGCIS